MSVLNDIDLNCHLRRLNTLCPSASWIVATDTSEVVAGINTPEQLDIPSLAEIAARRESKAPALLYITQPVYALPLTNHLEENIGWIFIGYPPGELKIVTMSISEQVNQLCTELALTDELNLMAAELAERYEELNLVYSTSEKVDAQHDDEEVLTNVVENVVDFLNVPFALVSVPEKNIWRWHGDGSLDHNFAESLWLDAEVAITAWLNENQQPLVLNEPSDFEALDGLDHGEYRALVVPIRNDSQEIIGSLTIMRRYAQGRISTSDKSLISAMAQKVAQTVHYSYDNHTGLPNQRKLHATLDKHRDLLEGRDSHIFMQVALRESDHIAEQWGQSLQARIYQYIAQQVQASARRSDLCFRLDDGSISALYLNCDVEEIRLRCVKLAHTIGLNSFMVNHHEVRPKVTIGLTEVRKGSESVDDYLFQVNMANRIALENNTNYVQVFNPDDKLVISQRSASRILATLHEALEHNLFELYAQSIAPMASQDDAPHFEILLRLFDTEGTFIPPGEFIPVGEKHRLMPEIDFWVIENTLEELAKAGITRLHPNTVCSINLSGQSFGIPNLTTKIQSVINQAGINPANICFEVTETAAIADLNQAQHFIRNMRDFGCKFALDDFGAGLSSFTYLRELALDYVKIDGSFVKDMLQDNVAATMVRSIHDMGTVMGLETVAEYVENEELANALTKMGVDFGQGFGIDKPIPVAEYLEQWTLKQVGHG